MIVRPARTDDAAEIANVHINSWREAYKTLLPAKFLDDRPLHFKNRYELWKRVTADSKQITFVVESDDYGVVGFINGNQARDEAYRDYTEVYCIYLLAKFHGQGLGYLLLRSYFDVRREQGYSKAYLWVLKDNPSIRFYERTGGKMTGDVKADEIGGQKVEELCYAWEDIAQIGEQC